MQRLHRALLKLIKPRICFIDYVFLSFLSILQFHSWFRWFGWWYRRLLSWSLLKNIFVWSTLDLWGSCKELAWCLPAKRARVLISPLRTSFVLKNLTSIRYFQSGETFRGVRIISLLFIDRVLEHSIRKNKRFINNLVLFFWTKVVPAEKSS